MDAAPRLADLTKTDLHIARAADLMRCLSAKAFAGRESGGTPAEYFATKWPHAVSKDLVLKSAVAPGTTSDANWAGPLVLPRPLIDAFVPLITQRSALLQLPLRRIPFLTPVSTQVSDASFAWVAEDGVKPLSTFAFSTITLKPTKTAGTVAITKEVARLSAAGSVAAMQDALSAGLAQFVDAAFLDPASTAIAGERPASVTAGLTPVTVGATLPETIAALVSAFFAGLPQASPSTTLVMSPATAGQLLVRDLPNLPIVLTPGAGANIIVLDPTRILTARTEAPELDVSDKAAMQMTTTPDDPTTATTVLASFWALNLIGIRSEWAINWQALPNAVAYAEVTP